MPTPHAEVTIGSSTERTDDISLDKHEDIRIKTSSGEVWAIKLDDIGRLEVRLVQAVGPRSSVAVYPVAGNDILLQAVNR
jgi:hypothetical protein